MHIRAMQAEGFVFITDNGRVLCYSHLGQSAKTTGRDISGQPILPMSKAKQANDPFLKCEECYPLHTRKDDGTLIEA